LALAWLLHKSEHIIPIPGTTSVAHLLEDLTASGVVLSVDLMQKLDQLINEKTVMGSRYNAQSNLEVDTEVFNHSV
jgi:aryl-alcohol dehydrogenase-like predicted oxidoreductase